MKPSQSLCGVFLLIALTLCVNQAFSQGKFELSAGLGMPEFYNIKARYGQNVQVGLCVGGYIGHGLFGSDDIVV
jgi:hypothetical protein